MANRRYIDFPIASTSGDTDIILIWQGGANKQTTKATFLSGLPENLDELNDVAISGLTNGQILRYDSVTGKWENTDQGNLDLNDLNDVSIVSPSNGQVLVYNSSTSKWENSSGGYVPYTGAVTTVNLGAQTIQAGQFVKAGGTSAQFLKADGSVDSNTYGTGTVTSVALTMPSAFSVGGSPITTAGTLAVTGAGTVGQYIRGDGSLADFPESSGGGSSVSYYLNGSVAQGTIGGIAYKELNKVPILGAGTNFTINADGYIASFITDAGDPNLIEIPGGNWNFETYFSASSGGGSPTFYVELYKVNSGGTATLIASNSGFPELIAFGTNIISYFSTLAVPTTTLALTDRLAIRYYVNHSGRTITLHTEDNHLCQIITTFTTGITALNGLTAQVQNFAVGTSGTDFNIASATATHTFNLPTASATNRGALSSADWSTFNNKENAITAGTTAQYFRGDKTFQTLNTAAVPELTNLYYTEARVNANTNVAANTAARHNAVTLGTANGLSLSTQVLSLGLASAGVTGALSGTDWSTFNSKQNALTNPVTGTGTSGTIPVFTGSTTIGNSILQSNSTQVNIVGNGSQLLFDSLGQSKSGGIQYTNDFELIINNSRGSGSSINLGNTNLDFNTNVTGNPRLRITSGGNILVGTTSDNGAKFQVSGTARFSGAVTANIGAFAPSFIAIGNSNGNGQIQLSNSSNYTIGAGTDFGGMGFYVGGDYRIYVLNNGNVGIGTTSPAGNLQVASSSSPVIAMNLTASATSGPRGDLAWYNSSISTVALIRASAVTDNVGTELQFYTRPAAGSLTERMRITSGGNTVLGGNAGSGWSTAGGRTTLEIYGSIYPTALHNSSSVGNSLSYNTYWDGANWRFVQGGTSVIYIQDSEGHKFLHNSSGTAGASFTPTERMRITSGGNVLIGTTTDSGENLQVKNGRSLFQLPSGTNGAILKLGRSAGAYYWHLGISGATSNFEFYDNGLNVLSNINVTTGAYTAVSDINKKKDFEDSTIGLNAILGLKPTLYRMKSESNTQKHLGFIAQEVKEYIPQAYMQNGDFIGLNEMPIIAALTKAIQELKQEIDTLKN